MAMQKITYDNKVAINVDSTIPDINKCNASDLNQIKSVVNNNADEVPTKTSQLINDSNFITPTDYATTQKGGVFKTETTYGTGMTNGMLRGVIAQDGQTFDGGSFLDASLVSKGSLKKWVDYKGFINKDVNDLTNYTKTSDLSAVATSGDYDDLTNKPTIPSISDEYGTSTTDGYSQNYLNENTLNPNGEATTTSENTSFNLTDTLEAPLLMDLKGNTQQTGTPTPSSPIPVNVVSGDNEIEVCGKNLFDNSQIELGKSWYGVENTKRARWYIKINPNDIYTISISDFTNISSIAMLETTSISESQTQKWETVRTAPFTLTHTFSNDAIYLVIQFESANDFTREMANNIKLMLNYGSTALPFEPYTDTTYNIDLPVENYVNNVLTSGSINGITYVVNEDKSVSLSGTATAETNFDILPNFNNLTIGETYTLSGCPSGGTLQTYRLFIRGTSYADYGSGVSFTCNNHIKNQSNGLRFIISNGVNVNGFIIKPQIEKGTKKNTYTPFGTTPIELNKIGTYQDYIYKENGKWYLHKETGKYVLTGTGATFQFANGIYYTNTQIFRKGNGDILSNYFTYGGTCTNTSTAYENGDGKISYNPSYGVYFRNDNLTSKSQWDTWLTTNNPLLYYSLETPTNTEITYTPLIEQLNTLEEAQSKEGTTNINQVNNDLPFIINATVFNDNYNGRYKSLDSQIQNNKNDIKDNLVNVGTSVDSNYRTNILYSYNLFSGYEDGYVNSTTGADETSSGAHRSYYIQVKPNTTYSMTFGANRLVEYTENKTFIKNTFMGDDNTITLSNTTKYVRLGFNNTIATTQLDSFMLNEGSTALPYEPYLTPSINIDGEEIYNSNIMNYSTNEQVIGKWIDGKPIYRKAFVGTTAPSSSSTTTISLAIDKLINSGGWINYDANTLFQINSVYGDLNNASRIIKNSSTSIAIQCGSNIRGKDYEIYVEYTKTTD